MQCAPKDTKHTELDSKMVEALAVVGSGDLPGVLSNIRGQRLILI